MKVKLLTEDRELAWLFLDVENAPEDACEIELTLGENVSFRNLFANEELFTWVMTDAYPNIPKLHVVNRNFDEIDLQNSFIVPAPKIVLDTADYDQQH